MTSEELHRITGWSCLPAGSQAIKAIAPLTLGNDGQHLAFYIASLSNGSYFLTDAGETAMHAEQMGVVLNKQRIASLNTTCGVEFASFTQSMEITAEGQQEDLSLALWDATKLAMALSFQHNRWMPKFHALRFRKQVEQVLLSAVNAERIVRPARAVGMSGHQLEFPFALEANGRLAYIEPIANKDRAKADWPHVYQAAGKMNDLKLSDPENERWIVFEDGLGAAEFGKAATLLSQHAHVDTLHGLPQTVGRYSMAA